MSFDLDAHPALMCRNLSKRYGKTRALSEVDLNIREGETLGLVGPNGAGKTTLIHAIVGLVRIDSGEITLYGLPVSSPLVKQLIGFMPDNLPRPEHLSAEEICEIYCRLYSKPFSKDALDYWAERFQISGRLSEPLGALSHGTARKVDCMAALLLDPDLLILDEPFSGLDPLMVDIVIEAIDAHRSKGGMTLLSSHDLELVSDCADEIIVLNHGRVALDSASTDLSTQELRQLFREIVSPK